jgi:aquaporin Z
MTFGLMSMVLKVMNTPKWSRYVGLFAGAIVATYITVEAPVSGMSMNPARSLASALFAGNLHSLLIYFIFPPLGMLAAAEVHLRCSSDAAQGCAKLHHDNPKRCIFCGANGGPAL